MTQELTRRGFLHRGLAAGAGALLAGASEAAAPRRSANEKLDIGVIGVRNQGAYNLDNVKDENIVALCDINDNYLGEAAKKFPQARTYNDFRRMLERKDLDA